MPKSIRTVLFVAGAVALTISRTAAADEGHQVRAHLIGYNEVPSINSDGNATFTIRIAKDRQSFDWTLSYAGLTGVTQSHVHFGQPGVIGGIVIWLCANNPPITTAPAGTQACGNGSNTISGTATAANVVAVAAQSITAGDFDAVLDAIHAGFAYANVHTTAHPVGEIRGVLKHH
jgi:CHRD domain